MLSILLLHPKKLRVIREWPTTKKKREIIISLCLYTYHRWFISGFTNIAKPPTKLTEEKQAFQWIPELKATF
jgi:hypothetical protein